MCANSKSSADERITNAHYLTQGYVIFQAAVQCRSEAGGPWERDHVEEHTGGVERCGAVQSCYVR